MEPPRSRPLETSGIPRLSRLPLPRSAASALPESVVTKSLGRGSARLPTRVGNPSYTPIADKQKTPQEQSEVEQATTRRQNVQSEEHTPAQLHSSRRRPRPSLSDRTMDTLAQIPPSPSPTKRRSSFFQTDSPMRSPSRPSSSTARARPSTSMGIHPPLPDQLPRLRPPSPEKRPLVPGAGNSTPQRTPQKLNAGSQVPRSLPHPRPRLSNAIEVTPLKIKPSVTRLRSNNVTSDSHGASKTGVLKQTTGAKTLGAKPIMSRPSAQDFFKVSVNTSPDQMRTVGRAKPCQAPVTMSSVPSRTSSNLPATSKRPLNRPSERNLTNSPKTTPQKSSASLREAISKAKAERHAAIKAAGKSDRQNLNAGGAWEDLDSACSNKGALKKRIQQARTDGRLNIAAMGLSDIPQEVLNMYDAPALESDDGAWYESVDLVRLVAADNQIQTIGENVFPDIDASSLETSDEEFKGNMFGGLETLDLHGNCLLTMPQGIRRLANLTVMNLSKNRLDNKSLAVVAQVQSLRELRMTENALEGLLNPSISGLQRLEVLDLSNNGISALPDSLGDLSNLQTLLLHSNRITSLPSTLFSSAALAVIDVSKNRLTGTLASNGISLPLLKSLDVSHNALMSVLDGIASMTSLESLNVAENRLESLPDLSASANLITLTVTGNRVAAIHESLVALQQLKNVDLSRNDLKNIDERFGLLKNLAVLRVENNPLRDRKFLSMNTEDLKRELRVRITPTQDDAMEIQDLHSHGASNDHRSLTFKKSWPILPGGILDRSSTGAATLESRDLQPLIEISEIKNLKLRQNSLTQMPASLALLASTLNYLDISHNKLSSHTYITTELLLPNLKKLDMSQNSITSFTTLLEYLNAPKLNELNVSRNHLTSLPPLRIAFPSLATILAADNRIAELKVEAVRGLQVLDVSGNEIEHLEPKLGLLANDGMRTLLVGANRFRVPRRDVVEKGTGAILAWLRGRIPDGEIVNEATATIDD